MAGRGRREGKSRQELLALVVPALAIVTIASGISVVAPVWLTIPLYVVAIAMLLFAVSRMSRRC